MIGQVKTITAWMGGLKNTKTQKKFTKTETFPWEAERRDGFAMEDPAKLDVTMARIGIISSFAAIGGEWAGK